MKCKKNYNSNINENPQKKDIKTKKSKMPYILSFLLLIVITLGGIAVWFYISNYSKIVFKTFIKNTVDYTKANIGINHKTTSTTFDMNLKINLKEEKTLVDVINKLNVSGKVNIDYKNNKAFLTLNTKYDKGRLLDLDLLYKEGDAYLLLTDAYSKFLKLDIDEQLLKNNVEQEDVNNVFNSTINAFNGSLKNEYFTRTFIGNLSKVSLKLNQKNIGEILTTVLTNLKTDEKFIQSLSKITKYNQQTILNKIDELLKQALKDAKGKNTKNVLIISVYTKKNSKDVLKVEVEEKNHKISLTINKQDNNTYSVNLETDKKDYSFDITFDNDKINIKGKGIIEEGSFEFEISLATKYNEKFEEPDTQNHIYPEDLTEQEINKIKDNFLARKGTQRLLIDLEEFKDLINQKIPFLKI